MGKNSFVLSALLSGHIWVALAQRPEVIPFPLTNATTTIPTSTVPVCENKCSVHYPHTTAVQWIPEAQIVYTEKVTIATIETVITVFQNTTLPPVTRTVWRPDATSKYSNSLFRRGTNAQGTQLVTLPVPDAKWGNIQSAFTYPTGYIDYASSYSWQGILQTQKESSSVCAIATSVPETVILPKHPNYPQPTLVQEVDKSDPYGQEHVPIYVSLALQADKSFLSASFPSESAFHKCEPVSPPPAVPTVFSMPKFITVSTILHTVIAAPAIGKVETSVTGFEDPRTNNRPPSPPTGRPENTFAIPRIQNSASGFEVPDPYTTPLVQPQTTLNRNEAQQSNGNPSINPINPTRQNPANPTPVFTTITTTINGVVTTLPAYIVPGSSTTIIATVGQTVTLDGGRITVLAAPTAYYTSVSTTVNGTPTVIPVLIVDGTSTATIGQTAVIRGQTTVVGTPSPSPTATGPANFEGAAHKVEWHFASLCVVLGLMMLM